MASSDNDVLTWDVERVVSWATGLRLGDGIVRFLRSQDIKGKNLLRLTMADLVSIAKMSWGDADDLMHAINEIFQGSERCVCLTRLRVFVVLYFMLTTFFCEMLKLSIIAFSNPLSSRSPSL